MVNVKIIRFAPTGDEIFRRRGIRLVGKKSDEGGMTSGFCVKGLIVRDFRQFGR